MSSTGTRLEIVQRAVKLAGRGAELHQLAKELLNDLCKSWSLEYKHPDLKKVGTAITLSAGSSTAALPDDLGAGMESLLFGSENIPLDEKTMDEFVDLGGFPQSSSATGRPSFYSVDKEAGLFRFNRSADSGYSFTPIYYKVAPTIPYSSAGDNTKIWIDDDKLAIQGLIELLYQYLGDVREESQGIRVERMKASWRRGSVPMGGGGSRIKLASDKFKRRVW